MPPLDFPASPATGATYTGPNGVVWSYDGAKWISGTSANVYAPVTDPIFQGNPQAPTQPPQDADTSIATTAYVTAAVATSLHDVGRNYIHNSMFNIAQRGAGPWTTNTAYTADRWVLFLGTPDTSSVSLATLADADRTAIGDEAAATALQNVFAGTSGAGAVTLIVQRMENVRRLAGKTVTLSFWARATSGTPKLGLGVSQYFGGGGSPSAPTYTNIGLTPALSTAWTRYTATGTVPSIIGKTIGTTNDCVDLEFFCSCPSANTALYPGSGSLGVQSGTIQLWGVQLEIGPTATPLEKLDPQQDLAKAQRFYQVGPLYCAGTGTASSQMGYTPLFPVQMRATPTLAFSGTPTYVNGSNAQFASTGPAGTLFLFIATANGYASVQTQFTASADL